MAPRPEPTRDRNYDELFSIVKKQRAVARGVLSRGVGRASALMLLTASLSGCVLPTQLTEAPIADLPPHLVADKVEPAFGVLRMDSAEFKLVVDDPNLQDAITARLFYRVGVGGQLFFQQQILLTQESQSSERHSGSFPLAGRGGSCNEQSPSSF